MNSITDISIPRPLFVFLPGMMTGQILAGVDPLIAIRYQIMVMCMLYGTSGIASCLFLTLMKEKTIQAAL